jgi:hypothetical protein
MNRWRVGEDRGSKETDGCPLTALPVCATHAVDWGICPIIVPTLLKWWLV